MSKDTEIEAKVILPKHIFYQMNKDFDIKSSFNQENYYFDTDSGLLKQKNISCRIRIFDDHAEQTLKVPDNNPLQHKFHEAIEINDDLALKEAHQMVDNGKKNTRINFQGDVGQFLETHFGDDINLRLQTYSKTHRTLANGPQKCELTFDETSYPDLYEDFELEIENPNPDMIKAVLAKLIEKYGFSQNSSTTNQAKIARAFKHRGKI